jgi:hypothetical protein
VTKKLRVALRDAITMLYIHGIVTESERAKFKALLKAHELRSEPVSEAKPAREEEP